MAALACLFILAAIAGLERLTAWSPFAARLIVMLCAAHFVFWYGIHAMRDENVRLAMAKYESWNFLNEGDPEGRYSDRPATGRDSREAAGVRPLLGGAWVS